MHNYFNLFADMFNLFADMLCVLVKDNVSIELHNDKNNIHIYNIIFLILFVASTF